MLPKLLMNGIIIKLESEAPTQEQVAHQQDIPYIVKYRCKFCEMLWLDKLALFFQILNLAIFSAFSVLKHFQKWSLKPLTIGTNQ